MDYKEKLLSSTDNSLLSYLGAAILGAVLSAMFSLVTSGQIIFGISIYIAYVVVVMFVDTLCKENVKWACEFNEFWLALEELSKKKLGQL